MFTIDEAHCVSEWGHDFRPDYLRLGEVIEELGHPTVLALTATAGPGVRKQITERLRMRGPRLVVRGFDRPNIWLGVERVDDERAKRAALVEEAAGQEGSGLLYAGTRRLAEDLAEELADRDVSVAAYHAGLGRPERDRRQQAFMEGDVRVMVATTAFGMGIDKPDVRFVLHERVSESPDEYYQEIGRAGRDGEPARALLVYRPQDVALRRFFAARPALHAREVARIMNAARSGADADELAQRAGLPPRRATLLVQELAGVGALVSAAGGGLRPAMQPGEAVTAANQARKRLHEYEVSRTEMMRGYAETRACRRGYLLDYFGEHLGGPCGNCDRCQQKSGSAAVEERERAFSLGAAVEHVRWGRGQVMRCEDDKVVVLFDSAGYRTLDEELASREGLLRRA